MAVFLIVAPLFGGEYAVLSTGFKIRADRHEFSGASVLLYTGKSTTEMPASLVVGFEEALDPIPVSPSAKPASLPASITPRAIVNPRQLVRDAAAQSGLPPALVESVARVESAFRPDAVSPKGALGIMQLMPETAQKLSADPRDPVQNTQAGARLLRELLIRYNGDVAKALAAYNAGSEAVDRYRGIPPYSETQNYVYQVLQGYLKAGGR